MKPSQVTEKLRKIAAAIENSKRPNPNLVAEDLEKLIVAIHPKSWIKRPQELPEELPPDNILSVIGNKDAVKEMLRLIEKRQAPDMSDPDAVFHEFIWAYAEDAEALTEEQLTSLRKTFDEAYSEYI